MLGKLQPLSGKDSGTFEAPVIVSNLSVSCGKVYCIKRLILSVPVDFALDTTAVISLISKDVWSQISKLGGASITQLQEWKGKRLLGVNGSALSVKGFRKFRVFLGDREVPSEMTLIVTSDLAVHEAILGLDFVEVHKCLIDYDRKTVTFPQ